MAGDAVAVLEVAEELVERFHSARANVIQTIAYSFDRLLAFAPQDERLFRRDIGGLLERSCSPTNWWKFSSGEAWWTLMAHLTWQGSD
jgi:hypothetical protein